MTEAVFKALDSDPGALGCSSQLHLRLEISGLWWLADKPEPHYAEDKIPVILLNFPSPASTHRSELCTCADLSQLRPGDRVMHSPDLHSLNAPRAFV